MTAFDRALAPFVDEDGLVLEKPNAGPGPNTGNGIHGLCVAMQIKILLRDVSDDDVSKFCQIIDTCRVQEHTSFGGPIEGLFHRGPRKKEELISHDDYRALAAVSYQLGTSHSTEIARYGQDHHWIFNNLEPGKFRWGAWHRRFPGLVGTYRLLTKSPEIKSNRKQDVDDVANKFWLGKFGSSPGGHLLLWMEAHGLWGYQRLDRYTIEWRRSVIRRWGSIRGLMREYYKQDDPSKQHAFTDFCPE